MSSATAAASVLAEFSAETRAKLARLTGVGEAPGVDLVDPGDAWPVHAALAPVLPAGLRRGSSLTVAGSLALLLGIVGRASDEGAWCALVGMPRITADAAVEYGIDLARTPVVDDPGVRWTTVVGALLDTLDVVVARPPSRLAAGDVQRLAARARSRGAVFVAYLDAAVNRMDSTHAWPAAELHLAVRGGQWSGADGGWGRLTCRRLTVVAEGRGRAARARQAEVLLPARGGGVVAMSDDAVVRALPTLSSAM